MTSLEKARAWLAAVWFGGGALFVLLLVGQSLGGMFGAELDKVWAWAIPNVFPTLGLMISVLASYALMDRAEADHMQVRTTFFRIACGVSAFYLLILLLSIVVAPFSAASGGPNKHPVEILHVSNFWLGPLQGLAAAVVAAVFFTTSKADTPPAV